MSDPDRDTVKALDRQRKMQRATVATDLDQVKHDLHPKTLVQRWAAMQRVRLLHTTDAAKQKVANNAPVIGLAGLGILLFSLRKPISGWISKLRAPKPDADKDDVR